MLSDIGQFIWAVAAHWSSWLTSGVLIAGIWIYEHYRGQSFPWRLAAYVVAIAFIVSAFWAWRDQHQGWVDERAFRSRAADDLAKLRHSAQKLYYKWWENCSNEAAYTEASREAEAMRVHIVDKLKNEISEAEADYVNTPRMFEPFPANRSLILCKNAPLINEFGYRLQRLSDVIQRLLDAERLPRRNVRSRTTASTAANAPSAVARSHFSPSRAARPG